MRAAWTGAVAVAVAAGTGGASARCTWWHNE